MEKSVYALTEHEVFVRELVSLYKQKPVLWQQKHPDYRNKTERAAAYRALVQKTQEYYPEADEDFVRVKLESMRSSFRKERNKVLVSKKKSSNPEDVHKPSLWYYDLLLFVAGEEVENETTVDVKREEGALRVNPNDGNAVKIPFWSRKHSAILISFYKNHPCLYSTSRPFYRNKRRRSEAIKKITDNLQTTTGKLFNARDVRRKISLIRGQFLHEYKKVKNCEKRGVTYKPTLWCFELLSFLMDEYENPKESTVKRTEKHMNLRQNARPKDSTSEESEEDVDIKKESDASLSSDSVHLVAKEYFEEEDDIFDTIAKNLAHQLRDMTEKQRQIANKIVREVMYRGQMEQLTENSKLSTDGS